MAARKFIPSQHPRDRFGRFTRSHSAQASPAELKAAGEVAKYLKPKRGITGDKAGPYLASISEGVDRKSVSEYTAGGYVDTHKALRAGKTDSPDVRAMDDAMIELPDSLVLSRRVPLAAFGKVDPESLVGLKVADAAYAPTSIGTVRPTKDSVRMRIAAPAGTRAAVDPDTGEVILDRDLEMVVAKVEKTTTGVDMYVTVLPKQRDEKVPDGDAADRPTAEKEYTGRRRAPDSETPAKRPTPAAEPASAEPPAEDEPDDGPADGADEVRAALMRKKLPELRADAKARGLRGYSRLRKSELVDRIVADETGTVDPEPAPSQDATARPAKGPGTTGADAAPEPAPAAAVEDRVLNAARNLLAEAGKSPTGLLRLEELRDRLSDIPRADVDQALRDLDRDRTIQLDPDPNRAGLTPRARQAAIDVAGEPMHLLSVRSFQAEPVDDGAEDTPPAGTSSPTPDVPDAGTPEADQRTLADIYNRLTSGRGGKPGDWASLNEMRAAAGDMPRERFDAAAKSLSRLDGGHLVAEDNQKSLTQAERDAAVRLGGKDVHNLALEPTALRAIRGEDRDQADAVDETPVSTPKTPPATTSPPAAPETADSNTGVSLPEVSGITLEARFGAALTGQAALDSAPVSVPTGVGLEGTERDSLTTYIGSQYAVINGTLRDIDSPGGRMVTPDDAQIDAWVADMDAAMNRSVLPGDVISYRGVQFARTMWGDRIDGDMTGLTWRESAYVSTSTSEDVIGDFARGNDAVKMRIMSPAGTRAVQMSGERDSQGRADEAELLIARGYELRVTADRGKDEQGVRHIDVEVIATAGSDNAAGQAAPAAVAPVTGARSSTPIAPNNWGTTRTGDPGEVNYHPDTAIGRAVRAMGTDAGMDVDGQPLANVVGVLGTQAISGRITAQQQLDMLKSLSYRLPEGSAARTSLDDAIADLDAPDTPPVTIPDAGVPLPAPLADLVDALNAVPLVRRDPSREAVPLQQLVDEFAAGKRGGLRFTAAVKDLRGKRHESREGRFEIDRAVNKAVAELEAVGYRNLRPAKDGETPTYPVRAAGQDSPVDATGVPA